MSAILNSLNAHNLHILTDFDKTGIKVHGLNSSFL